MKLASLIGFATLCGCAPVAPAADPGPADPGERAFLKCYSCHSLEPGRNDLGGPTLHGIVGRPIAAQQGFDYSPALEALAGREPRWTRALLDRFAADPEAVAPGTSMTFNGIGDPDERAALIRYLDRR